MYIYIYICIYVCIYVMMTCSLFLAWNTFKKTWEKKVDVESPLFIRFENFLSQVENPKFCKNIKKIIVINKSVNSITLHRNTLHVYQSPFLMNFHGKIFPCGLFLEDIIKTLIRNIRQNSLSDIKIIMDYKGAGEEEEEEEEDEEE